nr:LOW QUALITY PROTEIN: zinc finger protein CG2199 [Drosophila takahashii]
MASKAKKEVVCDHCHDGYEAKMIFTAQKSFVGTKMVDILEAITHKSIPPNTPIKICFICASGFMSTTALIEKVRETVDRILAAPAKKGKVSKKEQQEAVDQESSEEPATEIVDLTAEAEKKKTPAKKNTTIRQRSKSVAFLPDSPAISALTEPNTIDKALTGLNAMAASPKKIQKTPKKQAITASPKKLEGKNQLSLTLEDNLNDSVKLTPATNVSATKKVFINLFGNGDDDAMAREIQTESEEEKEEEGAVECTPITINLNSFQCPECEFHSKYGNQMKEHLQKEHGHQRPRIYKCTHCTKAFGVLKTFRDHLRDVHKRILQSEVAVKEKVKGKESEAKQKVEPKVKEQKPKVSGTQKPKEVKSKVKRQKRQRRTKSKESPEAEEPFVSQEKAEKTPQPKNASLKSKERPNKSIEQPVFSQESADETAGPKVASFKALNESLMRKRMLGNVHDSEYTFAINGSSASTPRAELANFQCEICDCELTTAKQMQEHMKTAHGIDKPKVFKCNVCEKSLTTKQSLKTHLATLHNEGDELGKSSKRKILQEEDEDVDIEGSFQEQNDTIDDDEDEGPAEEKIERETSRKDASLKDGLMSAPQSPVKKPKKAKNSFVDLSNVTMNGGTPSKADKRKKQEKFEDTASSSDIILLDEINHNVKPHKKARLESIGGDSTADESILSCKECGKFVNSRQRLELHIQKKHSSELKCPTCQDVFTKQLDYVSHFSDCVVLSGLPCGVAKCKKSFTEANFLSSHLRKRHHLV